MAKDKDDQKEATVEDRSMDEIRARVKKFFNHQSRVGIQNGVSMKTLFQDVFDANPEDLSHMRQQIYKEKIREAIRMVNKEIQIAKRAGKIFVAKTQEDADYYKGFMDRTITNCKNAGKRFQDWVDNDKWKDLPK